MRSNAVNLQIYAELRHCRNAPGGLRFNNIFPTLAA
jgi:hypothetical protein